MAGAATSDCSSVAGGRLTFKQIAAVTRLNLANLSSRVGATLVVVVGIGGVVAVLLGLLAMSSGFRTALVETAKPDRGLVLRGSSNNEMDGWVNPEELAILQTMDGLDVVSGEVFVTINANKRAAGTTADVVGRGVSTAAFTLRPEVKIVEGRRFESGKGEIIVGVQAAGQYVGLSVGETIRARNATWKVVGHFAAAGTAVESEIWMDLPVAQDVFRRTYSVVRVRLVEGERFAAVSERIAADPRLDVILEPETEFYAAQSASRAALIDTFAYLIAGIMALGSVIAALNTMYTAVSRRTVEIATLRALGFSNSSVAISVLVEAMLLALAGGVLAAMIVYVAFDCYTASTQNNASGAQLAFAFRVTAEQVRLGLSWALGMGFVGGLLPALRAARLPITQALRGD